MGMPRRVGGMDPAEIEEAFRAFQEARSPDALEAAIRRVPALSAPQLHAIIREVFLELSSEGSPALEGFAPRYLDYFRILHEQWHLEIVADIRAAHQTAVTDQSPRAQAEEPVPFIPPFWAALREAVGMQPPAEPQRVLTCDPAKSNIDELKVELHRLFGRDITLPPYEPTDGSSWCSVVLECAACGRHRLEVRAFKVDLVIAPDLAAPLRDGRINNDSCPGCGETCAYPISVPAMETPGPEDPLAALSCVWRLVPNVICYQPPPGTMRQGDKDQILEARLEALYDDLSWPDPPGRTAVSGMTQTSFSLAYSLSELIGNLDRVAGEAAVSYARDAMTADLINKVESGLLTLSTAIDAALTLSAQAGRDWPLTVPGPGQEWEGPPLDHLFLSLTAEGVAQAQDVSRDVRAMLASFTAWSLIAMGENTLAEAALARAEDLLAEAPPGEFADGVRMGVAEVRAHFLAIRGGYEESAAIRAGLSEWFPQSGTINARLAKIGLAGNQGLNLLGGGQYTAAQSVFERCIAAREAMLKELKSAGDGQSANQAAIRSTRHGLSGDLANLAAVLTEIADTASEADAVRLIAEAEGLLRRALELSASTESWEFAGIQAHRLLALSDEKGDTDEAEQFAALAVEYSSRAGDHTRVWTALGFLVGRELSRGDGPRAIGYLEALVRHRIRLEVGRGHHVQLLEGAEAVAVAAFRAVAVGGDPLRAVMIVESSRAASTAASLVAGTPYQLGGEMVPEALARALEDREQLRLHLAWHPDDTQTRARLREVEADLNRVRTSLALRDPRFGRWVDASDVSLAEPGSMIRRLAAMEEAGARAVWLGALMANDTVWTWTVDAHGAAQWASLPILPEESLAGLAEAILSPHASLLSTLRPADKLIVSVEGPLTRLPLAALLWEGKPLCEHAEIITVQGFGMFEEALSRPRIKFESYALVGAPRRPDAGPLPGADRELTAISALLSASGHSVDVANGQAATTAALISTAAAHDVVHIACHTGDDPSETGAMRLMLSPDIVQADSGDVSEDLIATALTLRPGALVNLAACSTAHTRDEGGSLLGGLVPAFLLAGAGCVMASLWPIADASAARFQLEFYRELASGSRPATALAAAQRRCLRGELGDEMRELDTWAAYVAYGGQ